MHGGGGAWVHGSHDGWVHGCMDAWVHGCMGAWVHGGGGEPAPLFCWSACLVGWLVLCSSFGRGTALGRAAVVGPSACVCSEVGCDQGGCDQKIAVDGASSWRGACFVLRARVQGSPIHLPHLLPLPSPPTTGLGSIQGSHNAGCGDCLRLHDGKVQQRPCVRPHRVRHGRAAGAGGGVLFGRHPLRLRHCGRGADKSQAGDAPGAARHQSYGGCSVGGVVSMSRRS